MVSVGDTAPPFELPNQDGDVVSLSDFAGDPVVVYFYPRADTPGCTTEACSFRDNWEAYRDRSVAVVGISDDPVEDVGPFAEKYDLPFDLLSDENGAVSSAYDSYGEKSMFGRTFDGVFRNTFVIDGGGTIRAVHRDVTPEGHAEAILADVEELGD